MWNPHSPIFVPPGGTVISKNSPLKNTFESKKFLRDGHSVNRCFSPYECDVCRKLILYFGGLQKIRDRTDIHIPENIESMVDCDIVLSEKEAKLFRKGSK